MALVSGGHMRRRPYGTGTLPHTPRIAAELRAAKPMTGQLYRRAHNVPMNLLPDPPETLLPDDPAAPAATAGEDPERLATRYPASSLAWANLARHAREQGRVIESYAFARVGYHRGLDALRRSGWKGHGPVPWSHEPNRGFLQCLYELSLAAQAIGETDEAERTRGFLHESSREAADVLGI